MSDEATKIIERRVRRACVLALIALALIVWSLIDPAPLPVIGAMTVGQAIGSLSLAFFLYAMAADLRTSLRRLRRDALRPAGSEPTDTSEPPPSA